MASENQVVNGLAASTATLIEQSIKAKEFSYSPYSKFRVGAALLTDDNKLFTGCNVENASYGLSICAERTAIVKAVSAGYTNFKEIAVSADTLQFASPCGACRQFIAEFGLDVVIHLVRKDGKYRTTTSEALLPQAFTPLDLEKHAKLRQEKTE